MQLLKRLLFILLGLLGLLVVVGGVAFAMAGNKLANAPDVAIRSVTIPTDAATVARGEHLVTSVVVCTACHGADLAGAEFIDDGFMGYVAAPNLTQGAGGVGAMSDAHWVRAIQHGIGADGRPLMSMPSNFYARLDDKDLGAIIAYLKSLPALDSRFGPRAFGPGGRLVLGTVGYESSFALNRIDHDKVGATTAPAEAATAEYGRYLSQVGVCVECHGEGLVGRTAADAEQGPPAGPNLTRSGPLNAWSLEQFEQALRAGQTPEGTTLDAEMPWIDYAGMSDLEVEALWAYLQTLDS